MSNIGGGGLRWRDPISAVFKRANIVSVIGPVDNA